MDSGENPLTVGWDKRSAVPPEKQMVGGMG
jgi:hypothetical protein